MKTERKDQGLTQKQVMAGFKRLVEEGLLPVRWLMMLDASPDELRRIIAAFPGAPVFIPKDAGVVYDAATVSRILGLPCECSDPVPEAIPGQTIVYYGGWDLRTLCFSSNAGKEIMPHNPRIGFADMGWKAKPGYYRLILRVPKSHNKEWEEQLTHLRSIDETLEPAPIAVALTALLMHITVTGNDPLKNQYVNCRESLSNGKHVAISFFSWRISINNGEGGGNGRSLIAAARIPPLCSKKRKS